MTAEEMFDELAYKKTEDRYYITYINGHEVFEFCKGAEDLTHTGASTIDIDELEAIYQQIKELGWLNDE